MLLCGLHDVKPGAVLGACVMDPNTPGHDLLRPGVTLDRHLIESLRKRGIKQLWIEDDLARDLDAAVAPQLTAARLEVYHRLRDGLAACSRGKLMTSSIQQYRQAVADLVQVAITSARFASLTDDLFGSSEAAGHGANVAFISLLIGLHIDRYLAGEQPRLGRDQACDPSVIGLAGLLHDIGKTRMPGRFTDHHEAHITEGAFPPDGYRDHVTIGKEILEHCRIPARITHAVLNHHQRFDGLGWPDMATLTGGRICGPLEGRRIHIFARIVAAANVLDNLMRDARGQRRPPVAALHRFASSAFDGWFDPVIRRAVLLRIPPFAIGTHVQLNDGRRGVILAPSPDNPCRPDVRILNPGAPVTMAPSLRLANRREVFITHALGEPVAQYLYEVPRADLDTDHYDRSVAA